jgi:hypothetical protein
MSSSCFFLRLFSVNHDHFIKFFYNEQRKRQTESKNTGKLPTIFSFFCRLQWAYFRLLFRE